MKGRIILYSGRYSENLAWSNPDVIFVFGDNTQGFGMAGQACIRDQPNAHGVPTKWSPSMIPGAFFKDHHPNARQHVDLALRGIKDHLDRGKDVVIPTLEDGTTVSLGLGLAALNNNAPQLYAAMCAKIAEFAEEYGKTTLEDEQSQG